MLTAIDHMLKDGTHHHDPGANHFDRHSTEIKAKRLAAQIAELGFQAELRPPRRCRIIPPLPQLPSGRQFLTSEAHLAWVASTDDLGKGALETQAVVTVTAAAFGQRRKMLRPMTFVATPSGAIAVHRMSPSRRAEGNMNGAVGFLSEGRRGTRNIENTAARFSETAFHN